MLRIFQTFSLFFFAIFSCGAFPFSIVNRTDTAPVIDGDFSDPVWQQSVELTGLVCPLSLDYAKEMTSLYLLYDDANLYGFLSCEQTNVKELAKESIIRDDKQLWNNHGIELFFLGDNNRLRQIILNKEGTVSDLISDAERSWTDWSWDAKFQLRQRQDATSWHIEFVLPLEDLGGFKEGSNPRFNFVRNNPSRKEYSSWSPLLEHKWMQLDQFGTLELGQLPFGCQLTTFPTNGPQQLVSLKFTGIQTTTPWQARVLQQGKVITSQNGVMEKGQPGEVQLVYRNRVPQGEQMLELKAGEKVFLRQKYQPRGELIEVFANNVPDNRLFLSPQMPAKIMWDSVHTLPVENPIGKRVTVKYDIVFDVPQDIRIKGGRLLGASPRGDQRLLYAHGQRFAYSAANWLGSDLETDLPEGSQGEIYYYVDWEKRQQAPEKLTFEVLQVQEVPPPKRFMTAFYNFWPAKLEDAIPLRNFGINTVHYRALNKPEFVKELVKAGFYVVRGGYFFPGDCANPGYITWPREDPEARALDINGNPISGKSGPQFSPSYRGKLFQQAMQLEREFAKASGINYFSFDMEGYIMPNAAIACFNPETIRRFEIWLKEKYPTMSYRDPREFERKPAQFPALHQAWIEFKDYIFADFFNEIRRQLSDVVGQTTPWPGVNFSEWAYQVPDSLEKINNTMRGPEFFKAMGMFEQDSYSSTDRFVREHIHKQEQWRKSFPELDIRFLFCPSPERLDLNRTNLKNYYYSPAPLLDEELKYKLMQAAVAGYQGIVVWSFPRMNLRAWKYWCEGLALINKVEEIILDGQPIDNLSCDQPLGLLPEVALMNRRVTLKDQPKILLMGRRKDNKALIAVSEYYDLKPVTVTVKCPVPQTARIKDLEDDRIIGTISAENPEFKIHLDKKRCRLILLDWQNEK